MTNRVNSLPAWDSQLDLFHGDVSPNLARLYARLPRDQESSGDRWQGTLRGPFMQDRRTLPMTTPWLDLGPGPTLLAQALVTDPVCWSPEQPAWYESEITLHHADKVIGSVRRTVVIRRLGDNGTRWRWDQQLWRLTAIAANPAGKIAAATAAATPTKSVAETIDWADLRRREQTLVVRQLPHDAAAQAVRWGVPLVLWLDQHSDVSWRAMVREPAVTFAVLPAGDERGEWLREHVPNIIRLERHALPPVTESQPAARRASWAQAVAVDAQQLDQASAAQTEWLVSTLLPRNSSGSLHGADSVGVQRVPLVLLRENSAVVDSVDVKPSPGRLPTAGWMMLTQELLRNPG
jgi:hypothetical protein